MSDARATLASFQPIIDRVVGHLVAGQDTALIAAPGCGLTTLVARIADEITRRGCNVVMIDCHGGPKHGPDITRLRAKPPRRRSARTVSIVDGAVWMPPGDLIGMFNATHDGRSDDEPTLWLGPFDARALAESHDLRLHGSPRSHVCLPPLTRDDALAAYRVIAQNHDCRWGDAILFLLLDLCGNDLALATSIGEYLHGNWTDKLYDDSVWDRVAEWLANDPRVAAYRRRLATLDEDCQRYLALLRFGGKPPCHRDDLLEEPDAALRELSLAGILVPNLLPGFYQVRNLTVRYLIDEHFSGGQKTPLESLFRRAANERVGQLLQDAEMMLRAVLRSAFADMSEAQAQDMLMAKQGDAELLPGELNRDLLKWAGAQEAAGLRESLNALLVEHRKQFKLQNSVWARVERIMKEDADDGDGLVPLQQRAVDYLTFSELGDFVIDSLDRTLPGPYRAPARLESVKERWRDALSKIRRLRNRVAHHRNIEFQDMEDLAGCIESMRRDLYNYGAWR